MCIRTQCCFVLTLQFFFFQDFNSKPVVLQQLWISDPVIIAKHIMFPPQHILLNSCYLNLPWWQCHCNHVPIKHLNCGCYMKLISFFLQLHNCLDFITALTDFTVTITIAVVMFSRAADALRAQSHARHLAFIPLFSGTVLLRFTRWVSKGMSQNMYCHGYQGCEGGKTLVDSLWDRKNVEMWKIWSQQQDYCSVLYVWYTIK